MTALVDALRSVAKEVRETHISWVFLHDTLVYKVKKPVSLGFLDFSNRELRKAACEAELELNRRLAPNVYVGMAHVTRDAAGHYSFDGSGEVEDYAVVMRRLADEHRLDRRLLTTNIDVASLDRIASHLVAFHEQAETSAAIRTFGEPEQVLGNIEENFEQARDEIVRQLGSEQAGALESWQRQFVADHRDWFAARVVSGRVRDGHGDLKAEHVYLTDEGVQIIDCIEFNDRFRYGDVAADLAFLSMDLYGYGRTDLAERLLAHYALLSNDYELYRVVDFYESYRACVRGKISSMLASQPESAREVRERAEVVARRYFLLARALERTSLITPTVVAIGGIIASGKSTVADSVSLRIGGPMVSSDRVRKHLLGKEPQERISDSAWQGGYREEISERVYGELLRRARMVLESGRPVVIDASFRCQRHRALCGQLARELGLPFLFIECRVADEVCRERLVRREQSTSVSDARLALLDDFRARWEPVNELRDDEHIALDTALPLERNLERLESRLALWPETLTR